MPADPPVPGAPGDIFQNYDPVGAMGGLFAPAYIHGPTGQTFQPSENAVANWQQQNHGLTRSMVDELRMPNPFQGPQPMSAGNYPYGGPIPLNQSYGDPRGSVDPEALRVLSQGGHYDVQARRNAIAQRLAGNTAAQAAVPAATDNSMFLDENGQPFDIQAYQQALAGNPGGKFIGTGMSLKKSMFPIRGVNQQDYNNVGA